MPHFAQVPKTGASLGYGNTWAAACTEATNAAGRQDFRCSEDRGESLYLDSCECDEQQGGSPWVCSVRYECSSPAWEGDSARDPYADSCEFAADGTCDEPDLCAPGTDTNDCGADFEPAIAAFYPFAGKVLPDDTCQWAGNGMCEEPLLCERGTDTSDCIAEARAQEQLARALVAVSAGTGDPEDATFMLTLLPLAVLALVYLLAASVDDSNVSFSLGPSRGAPFPTPAMPPPER
ncbi:MAG: hypothetical protein OXH05_03870 [Acidobacteria bacterium]|nr:hypothetical protein [Acidobacteriota bacterium]